MPTRYTHTSRIVDYTKFLYDDIFDRKPRVSLSGDPPLHEIFYARFRGRNIRIDFCADGTVLVFGRSQRQANNLAKQIREECKKRAFER